jgi:hypothetical protein
VLVAVVAVGFIAGGIAVWGPNGAGATATAKPPGLALLGGTATVLDALPPAVDAAKIGGGVNPASVRFIQAGTAGAYWAGLDARGDVCLIVATDADARVSGAACVAQSVFSAHGLGYRLVSKGHPVAEAYLFPDTVFTGSATSNTILGNVIDAQATVSYYGDLLLINPAATKAQRDAIALQLDGWFDLGVLPPVK